MANTTAMALRLALRAKIAEINRYDEIAKRLAEEYDFMSEFEPKPLPAASGKDGTATNAAKQTEKSKKRKRKKSPAKQQRAMTTIECLDVTAVSRNGGNFSAAAKELGKDRKTVRENNARGISKLERLSPASRSVSAGRMPLDHRGQENV